MSGVALEVDGSVAVAGLDRLNEVQLERLVDEISSLVEDQTRARIEHGKAGPDGTPWPAWSPVYALTRHANQSLLVDEHNLLESLQNYSRGLEAIVATQTPYSTVHQFGSDDGAIPARPYLGLSAEDRADVEALVTTWIEELLA